MSQTYRKLVDKEDLKSLIRSESERNLGDSVLEKRDQPDSLNLEIEKIQDSEDTKKLKSEEKGLFFKNQLQQNLPMRLDEGTADFTKKVDSANSENNLIFNLSKKWIFRF